MSNRLPALLVHAVAAIVLGHVLVSAAQPLFAEDTWWHLAMGEAYAAAGPRLAADPLLHTASGPPAPAAWLADLVFYGVERSVGFNGLRIFHALLVAGIFALVWTALRRAGGAAATASLAAALFAVLSAYRLFQLRPELFSILATLALYRLLIEPRAAPSWRRVAAAVGLLALWANLHGAFVLGPALLGAAVAGLAVGALLRPERRAKYRSRGLRLAVATALGLLATLANPTGFRPHLLYFAAGGETPALEIVTDEWARLDLFQLPVSNLPPSPLAWAVFWALLLAGVAAVVAGRRLRRRAATPEAAIAFDPALLAVALLGLLAPLVAVRFLWLAIFPLLAAAEFAGRFGGRLSSRRVLAWGVSLGAVLLVPAFLRLGDWPMISQGVQRATYERPYPAGKYKAHAVWFLRDAGLEGNLFNDYSMGNFLGYWLAPRLRVFLNGSLNLPKDAMAASHAIRQRSWQSEGAFLELLDHYDVDVFFGSGEAVMSPPGRPRIHTTTHLERAPGWIPIFRNLRSGVYLRADARNRENLERTAAWYAQEGVPFDLESGFEVARVLREAPDWAIAHGLVPAQFATLRRTSHSPDPNRGPGAQSRLATLYAALGLYERAAALDRRLLRSDPQSIFAARRLVWSLLHQQRGAESRAVADQLAAMAPADDRLSWMLIDAARQQAELSPGDAEALVATLPVLLAQQRQQLRAGVQEPESRPRKD